VERGTGGRKRGNGVEGEEMKYRHRRQLWWPAPGYLAYGERKGTRCAMWTLLAGGARETCSLGV